MNRLTVGAPHECLAFFWRALSSLTAAEDALRGALKLPVALNSQQRDAFLEALDKVALAANGLRDAMARVVGALFGFATLDAAPLAALPLPPTGGEPAVGIEDWRYVLVSDMVPAADLRDESAGMLRYEVSLWRPGSPRSGAKAHATIGDAYRDAFKRLIGGPDAV